MKKILENRWSVVFGAVLLQLCVGAIYSWSLFNQPLMDKFGWTNSETVFTFSLIIFVFAFVTILSGRLQDKIGPKIVATIGGLFYGVGLMLSSTATSTTQLYIYYGVISGIGVGFVYVCPLATCIKWFPDKKGFITGIAVGAFGLGSLVFKSVIQHLLDATGVSATFLYLGIIYTILIIIGAQFLRVPGDQGMSSSNVVVDSNNFTVLEMVKTKAFYLIWIVYLLGSMSGLLVIGLAKDIGVELANLDPVVATSAVSMIALFNAAGRLSWGALSDRMDRLKVVFMMFSITAICMVIMSVLSLNFVTYFVSVAGIAFCFGGFLAVFPTITGEFYGIKNLGANYGVVYQAYGVAALVGPMIVAYVGGLKPTFIIAAILSIIGAVVTLTIKKPMPSDDLELAENI
ncbi:OFA family MFS transporter [Serpentinicella sp. ANB-PHB4]|uniref:L-lactate MFS transporter n=1 Tax=Serpentinicella sp. ANB-PHB4 TaxID=3074076 RepID=UPI00285E813E|nr:OFA family MFS transporter [Serpentinicella sp. ANB-PHB4]MDR5659165.1 OFA family MFS transporter [Serpentinicella sp. ANB-PHB4]